MTSQIAHPDSHRRAAVARYSSLERIGLESRTQRAQAALAIRARGARRSTRPRRRERRGES